MFQSKSMNRNPKSLSNLHQSPLRRLVPSKSQSSSLHTSIALPTYLSNSCKTKWMSLPRHLRVIISRVCNNTNLWRIATMSTYWIHRTMLSSWSGSKKLLLLFRLKGGQGHVRGSGHRKAILRALKIMSRIVHLKMVVSHSSWWWMRRRNSLRKEWIWLRNWKPLKKIILNEKILIF